MSVLCNTAPVYLSATGTPAQATAQTASFWSRVFGTSNGPAYQGPAASAASSTTSPPTTSPPTTSPPTTSPPTTTTPPAPPLREVIVVVPDSLFQSFTDQIRTVGLAVERPRG